MKRAVKSLRFRCSSCGSLNRIPMNRIYDGYEGPFLCSGCGDFLDKLHDVLDDEISN